MPNLIKNAAVVADDWTVLDKAEAPAEQVVPTGKVIIPLSTWLAQREQLLARAPEQTGVWLDSDEEPDTIGADLSHFSVIAVNFPKFADGRGYSIARILREQLHYAGELRAIGDVLMDQLFFMKRCGFDAFAVRADRDAEKALAGLADFSVTYQASVDQPEPLFRRRMH
ncbi:MULTISPECIES: DUF934 domain-containing protein [unclassified Hahella]|uniref:DUF934 domain-containing protein n=1 Tax=unclassified Hahella TaxID=2624107 RepID=UPI001C1ECD67|nr:MULTISPECIES: DUF934 domain-containing protein [unclassified Hahella]MBU6950899.1 DUF934 domain-containing protein [Hahella sp. HN01]MDG9667207.1 DUF934 domain-containing protein [Hahella sp. CR1]